VTLKVSGQITFDDWWFLSFVIFRNSMLDAWFIHSFIHSAARPFLCLKAKWCRTLDL
jgi:hypothetical protein